MKRADINIGDGKRTLTEIIFACLFSAMITSSCQHYSNI